MKLFVHPYNSGLDVIPSYAKQVLTLGMSTFAGQGEPPTIGGLTAALQYGGLVQAYPKAWIMLDMETPSMNLVGPSGQTDQQFNDHYVTVHRFAKLVNKVMRPTRRMWGYFWGAPLVFFGYQITTAGDKLAYDQRAAKVCRTMKYIPSLSFPAYYNSNAVDYTWAVGPVGDKRNNVWELGNSVRRKRAARPRLRRPHSVTRMLVYLCPEFADTGNLVTLQLWTDLVDYCKTRFYGAVVWPGVHTTPVADARIQYLINACDKF